MWPSDRVVAQDRVLALEQVPRRQPQPHPRRLPRPPICCDPRLPPARSDGPSADPRTTSERALGQAHSVVRVSPATYPRGRAGLPERFLSQRPSSGVRPMSRARADRHRDHPANNQPASGIVGLMGTRIFRTPASHRPARLVTGLYAVATVVALALTLFARSRTHPTLAEEVFGLLNVPVAATFVSVVVLALATRALWGRKRIGLWFVAVFQAFGIYLGVAEMLPARAAAAQRDVGDPGGSGPWPRHRLHGRGRHRPLVAVAHPWRVHRSPAARLMGPGRCCPRGRLGGHRRRRLAARRRGQRTAVPGAPARRHGARRLRRRRSPQPRRHPALGRRRRRGVRGADHPRGGHPLPRLRPSPQPLVAGPRGGPARPARPARLRGLPRLLRHPPRQGLGVLPRRPRRRDLPRHRGSVARVRRPRGPPRQLAAGHRGLAGRGPRVRLGARGGGRQ